MQGSAGPKDKAQKSEGGTGRAVAAATATVATLRAGRPARYAYLHGWVHCLRHFARPFPLYSPPPFPPCPPEKKDLDAKNKLLQREVDELKAAATAAANSKAFEIKLATVSAESNMKSAMIALLEARAGFRGGPSPAPSGAGSNSPFGPASM